MLPVCMVDRPRPGLRNLRLQTDEQFMGYPIRRTLGENKPGDGQGYGHKECKDSDEKKTLQRESCESYSGKNSSGIHKEPPFDSKY